MSKIISYEDLRLKMSKNVEKFFDAFFTGFFEDWRFIPRIFDMSDDYNVIRGFTNKSWQKCSFSIDNWIFTYNSIPGNNLIEIIEFEK